MLDEVEQETHYNSVDLNQDLNFAVVSDTVPAGVMVIDIEDGSLVYTNPAFAEILGCSEAGVLGRNWQSFFHDVGDREALMVKFVQDGFVRNHELRLVASNGEIVWVLASMTTVDSDDRYLLLTSFIDITSLKNAEEQIRKLADQDALTQLPNLRCTKSRLERALLHSRRYGGRIALIFVDLDGFKPVNDQHGHDAGDTVLKEVAKRLMSATRECDTVGRIGGDEFLIVLTEVAKTSDVDIVADRVMQAVAQPISVEDAVVHVSASLGGAISERDGDDAKSLIKAADKAMYQAKRNGRASFVWSSTEQTSDYPALVPSASE